MYPADIVFVVEPNTARNKNDLFVQISVFSLLLSIEVSAMCKVTWHLYPAAAKLSH